MKAQDIFGILILTIFSLQFSIIAQTKTWTNATGNDTWMDQDNWAPIGVPISSDDVLIPENSIVNVEDIGNGNAFMNTITVEEGSVITKFSPNNMTMTSGVFAPDTELNILEGNITIVSSLTINGALNGIGPLSKGLRSNAGVVNITGTMSIQSPSEPFTLRSMTLRIFPSGILTVEEGSIAISAFTATLLNEGLIQKTAGNGTFTIATVFENNGGIIDVLSGSMAVANSATLTNGEYNVNAGGFFQLNGGAHFLSGNLEGQLDGPFIFNSEFRVINNTENFLSFTGAAGVEWRGGALSAQGAAGSTLVNHGILSVSAQGAPIAQLGGGVILRNEGEMSFNENIANFNIGQSSVLTNATTGIINVNDGVNIPSGSFINLGLIQKLEGTGSTTIGNLDNREAGVLFVDEGDIIFPGIYEGTGRITGDDTIITSAATEIEGTIAPGKNGSGTLIYGNSLEFDSTEDTIYEFEIDGLNPDTQHDVLDILSNAKVRGNIEVNLGFAPQLDDTFEIIKANSVTVCDLPAQIIAMFTNDTYTFEVVCGSDNVTLRVSDVILSVNDTSLNSAVLYPNPNSGNFTLTLGESTPEVNVTITNILGQIISSERFVNKNTLNLNIEGSSGVYFVTVNTSEERQKTFKIIKQ